MPTQTISLTDSVYIKRSPSPDLFRKDDPPRHLLIYFIPGNPGYIEYYYDFLTHLASLLEPDVANRIYHVVGHSLGGFELSGNVGGVLQLEAMMTGSRIKDRIGGFHSWGLARQQAFIFQSLRKTVDLIHRTDPDIRDGRRKRERKVIQVMLVGHSVGAYLMMQSLKWRHNPQTTCITDMPIAAEALQRLRREEHLDMISSKYAESFDIVGGMGLFPTVVDLAGSPRGRMLAPLAKYRWFASVVQYLAYILRVIPGIFVQLLVEYLLRQPRKAADVTAAFLQSRYGVYQALFMAREELLEITTDKWDDEVWDQRPNKFDTNDPQLYFFWGENDHWVQNSTRDKIIRDHARLTGRGVPDDCGRPYMEVDNTNIPHDFCIQTEHSERVAEKVSEFVRDRMAFLRTTTDYFDDQRSGDNDSGRE